MVNGVVRSEWNVLTNARPPVIPELSVLKHLVRLRYDYFASVVIDGFKLFANQSLSVPLLNVTLAVGNFKEMKR